MLYGGTFMKRFRSGVMVVCAMMVMLSSVVGRAEEKQSSVLGNFEMMGYISVGGGWQRFMKGTTTEIAVDGSYAGVLGSVLPEINTGAIPAPGQDNFMFFVEAAELDLIQEFKDRVKLRADLLYGRAASGSWVGINGIDVEQAYATVILEKDHDVELTLGRFGTPMGFEPFEPHNSDTISWSILGRSGIYPDISTGISISANITESLWMMFALSNGLANDTTLKINDVPCGYLSFKYAWGEKDQENSIQFSPFFGPESQSNRHFSMGADLTVITWIGDKVQLGLEGNYRRDDANPTIPGAENTNYYGGLMNLRYDFTKRGYGVIRYSFVRQDNVGNGILNLTGQEQNIHEMSLGGGYALTEEAILKFEGRVDLITPAGAAKQVVPGVAMSLAYQF